MDRHLAPARGLSFFLAALVVSPAAAAQGKVAGEWMPVGTGNLTSDAAICPQIVFDAGDLPTVVFQDSGTALEQCSAMRFSGGAWTFLGVQGAASVGRGWYNHAVYDAQGGLLAVSRDYGVQGKGNVRRYDPATGAWSNLGAPFSSGEAHHTHLILSPSGVPHVVFVDKTSTPPDQPHVRRYVSGQWQSVGSGPIPTAGTAGYTSIAWVAGQPWIAFQDNGAGGRASVMKFDAASNAWMYVGPSGFSSLVATNMRLATSPSGAAHVAYLETTPKRVTVLRWDGSSWVPVGGPASDTDRAVIETENWRQWLSLVFDEKQRAYIGYQDLDKGKRLTVRRFENGGWQILGRGAFTPVQGDYHALALNSYGQAYAVYRNGPIDQSVAVQRFVEGAHFYCSGKVNSAGSMPEVSFLGTPDMSGPDDFVITASHLPNKEFGFLIWGLNPASKPLSGGTLCVAAGFKRMSAQGTGGSSQGNDDTGTLAYFLSQSYMASKGLTSGTTVYSQFWFRDTGHPDGTGVGMTGALEFLIGQ